MATKTLSPNGVGDETAIPNLVGAATHWQAVLTNDGDTSYVETPDVDDNYYRDLYALEDSSDLGAITDIQLWICGRIGQDTVGYSSSCMKFSLKTYDTVYDVQGALPSAAYGFDVETYATNPYTGDAWTWAEIDALQAGVSLRRSHIFSPPKPRWARCTQVYVVVTYTPTPFIPKVMMF